MKKYLLFDLDGTLTDPKIGITTCVQYALKSQGIEEPDLNKLEPFIGPPLKESFKQFYGMDDARAEEAVAKYRERFQDVGLFENKIYDGIPAMLKVLQSKGMHLAVASSKPTVFVDRILEHFHIKQYFEVIVGSELDGTRVNKDEVVQETLNRLFHYKPIQRSQVYMIGDRKFDVEGAKAMQVESVGVAYGYGSMEELKEAKADYIVRSVAELQKFLLRGTDEPEGASEAKKASPPQRLWALVMPLMMFTVMKGLTHAVVGVLAKPIGTMLPETLRSSLFVRFEENLIEYSGNMSVIVEALAYIVAAAVVWKRAKQILGKTADAMKLSHLKREPKMNYVLLSLMTVGAAVGLNLLFALIGITEQSAAYQDVVVKQYAGTFVLGFICFGLISPIAEELLFRGILYGYLRHFGGIKMGILLSAILFGMYHGNAVQTMYAFLFGCLIAYGYEYFGDFKIAVIIHMAANIIAYTLTYLNLPVAGTVMWVICAISLAVMMGSVFLLHRRKNIL